ncbi:MAG: class I SAM-dependent methyltransferase [Thermoanaerobaculia bacterium]|nr:class I SAM-dependent methyltransferase [Thermoanaerobaculia bacterium]
MMNVTTCPTPSLYGEFAARYDLHTRPEDYQADQDFVLAELADLGTGARVLDLGCGTGVLLARLREAGFEARGIDAAPAMVELAQRRLGAEFVSVGRIQDLGDTAAYDALVSLALPFNYVAGPEEAQATLERFHRALVPGGRLILQVAHAANAPPVVLENWEAGPGGERDIQFLCRFRALPGPVPALSAQYVYVCRSLAELMLEEHRLEVADVYFVAQLAEAAGFRDLAIFDNARREPLRDSMAPFLTARA